VRVNRSALLLLALLLAGAAGAQSPSPPRSAPWRPLTPPAAGDPLTITLGYLADRRGPLGLSDDDLAGWVVRSRFVTRRTGVTHLVLSQQLDGIDVFKAGVTASIDPAGRLVAFGDRLVRDLRARAASRRPVLSAAQAVASAAQQLGLAPAAGLTVRRRPGGAARAVVFAPSGLSRDEIPVRLEFVPTESEVRLAWNVVIRTPDGRHWWNLHVDTGSGALLRQDDWIDHDSYRFFAPPLANPDEGPRSLLVSPADPVASPFGWHDTDGAVGAEFSDTRGNNVFAQEDADADDLDGHRPDGGAGLDFDFPIDFAQQPSGYRDAATTNLFSWNNFLHDVMYRYGFDEPGSLRFGRGQHARAGDARKLHAVAVLLPQVGCARRTARAVALPHLLPVQGHRPPLEPAAAGRHA